MRSVPPVRPEFVLFGDSITQQSFMRGGWGAKLTDEYSRTADITLRGYSGYNTRWALQLLPGVFPPTRTAPALVTVFFGANDACRPAPLHQNPEDSSRQHVPLEEYRANLRRIIADIRACGDGSARILLLTPPPIDDKAWASKLHSEYGIPSSADPNRLNSVTRTYAQACVETGAQLHVPTVDLWSAFQTQNAWQSMFSDGLHPNAEGGAFIYGQLRLAITAHFAELLPGRFGEELPSKLPLDFPDHKNLNLADLPNSFQRHRLNTRQCAVYQPRAAPTAEDPDDDPTGPVTNDD